jgi:hypothetical protein
MTGRKLREKRARWYTMMCNDTGLVAMGKNAKWRIKDGLARVASYDGKLRFSPIKTY